jgi:hypothetical protein
MKAIALCLPTLQARITFRTAATIPQNALVLCFQWIDPETMTELEKLRPPCAYSTNYWRNLDPLGDSAGHRRYLRVTVPRPSVEYA